MKKKRNNFLKLMAICWFLLIAVFWIARIVKVDGDFSDSENRVLASKPSMSVTDMTNGSYESDYEVYVNDQFPLRSLFVRGKVALDVMLGKKENNQVILAKDGYLFERFSAPEQKKSDAKAKKITQMCEKYPSINHYFMLVPTGVNILSDKLPAGIPVDDQNKAMERFYQKLPQNVMKMIDVRSVLSQHKDDALYYKTDHHWTTEAAYLCFRTVATVLGINPDRVSYEIHPVTDQFKGSLLYKSGFRMGTEEKIDVYFPIAGNPGSIVSYTQEQKKTATFYNHDKLATRSGYEVFLDGNHSMVKIQTPIKDNHKVLLLFKDSYANCFIPFLAPYYSEILVIDPRYYYDNVDELITEEAVTDIMYLYNANTFFTDDTLTYVLN